MTTKKLLVLSDFHCGHVVGLTPPHLNPHYNDPKLQVASDYRDMLYSWFSNTVKTLGKFDAVVVNGDLIDGKGERSGGTEIIENDPQKQADMAVDIIKALDIDTVYLTYGTPYHTGKDTDYEDSVAKSLGCKIESVLHLDLNGVIFNFRHKVGGSQVPHGRGTAILREQLWNQLWADRGEFPKAHVVVRSHVHYHQYAGTFDHLAMITPALQGYGSKFGERQVGGTIDFGFVTFEVTDKGVLSWTPFILRMPYQEPQTV